MANASSQSRYWLTLSFVIVFLDQASKYLALHYLEYGVPYKIASFFNIILLYNTGTAFSLLSGAGGWQRWFLSAIALIMIIVLRAWLIRLKPKSYAAAFAICLVLGGAIGNFIDRIRLGYVIDFIQWHYHDYYWPVFNLADSAITVGAILLLWHSLRNK